MEKGRVVEPAASRAIFTAPAHAYTRKLMRATPRPGVSLRELLSDDDAAATSAPGSSTESAARSNGKAETPLLVVEKLVKEYPRKGVSGGWRRMFQPKPAPEPE